MSNVRVEVERLECVVEDSNRRLLSDEEEILFRIRQVFYGVEKLEIPSLKTRRH